MSITNAASNKELTLAVLTVAVGLANAWLWKDALFTGEFRNAAFYSLPVVSLIAFAILFALSSAFIRERLIRGMTAILGLSAGYLFLSYTASALPAAALSGLGGWYAASTIANETAASNSFRTRKILRGGLPVFFTSVALMLAVFYFSLLSAHAGFDQLFVPKALFDAAVPLLEKPLRTILPGFRTDASVDDLLLASAAAQLGEAVDLGALSRPEREALLEQGREALTAEFGVTLRGDERAGDVLYQVTNAQFEKFLGPYRRYLPLISAVGFFIAVKALTLPLYWLTTILVFIVIRLLAMAGFLERVKETVEVERLKL